MRIQYICHACLRIDTGDVRLATDPWFDGPAYSGQWHVFPRPLEPELLHQAEVVLISHAHEDHLHEPTLRRFAQNKLAVYPYYWDGDTVPYLREMGFSQVIEAPSYKTIRLTDRTTITFVTVGQDSVMVIEANGRIVANVNDALHSCEPAIIDRVTAELKARWPTIDTVFCGFGGASHFPNTIHCDGKDDMGVARVREELFVHNFCRIVKALQPAVAVPFAADFVLLADNQRWINTVRFPRERIPAYYDEHFRSGSDRVRILPMYPGDVLEDNVLQDSSPYRRQMRNGSLGHLVAEQYAKEIRAIQERPPVQPSAIDDLEASLTARLSDQAQGVSRARLGRMKFSIRLNDTVGALCLNVSFAGNAARVERAAAPAPGALFVLETHSGLFRSLFTHPWAGDVLIIGYGGEIRVTDSDAIKDGLLRTATDLLTAYPNPISYTRRHPVRIARYALQNLDRVVERIKPRIERNAVATGNSKDFNGEAANLFATEARKTRKILLSPWQIISGSG